MTKIAFFVSPHGFGHAARSSAVIEALGGLRPEFRFSIHTTVPRWFFAESLTVDFEYHRIESDVGLVQVSPMQEDLEATAERLDDALWWDSSAVEGLAAELSSTGCKLVVADISPLGLSVAKEAGLPSVLVENFTWDWIYTNHGGAASRLADLGERMTSIFSGADLRIQTTPVCLPVSGAVTVPPVARRSRVSRVRLRQRLAIPEDDPMVLLSMGGVRWGPDRHPALQDQNRMWVVVPGGAERMQRCGRTLLLPFHSDFYHPDLVAASDVVVGKLGYSTVAETFRAGSSLAYMVRPRFPESVVLEEFVGENLTTLKITEEVFRSGTWTSAVERLLEAPRRPAADARGAEVAAETIIGRFLAEGPASAGR